MPASVVACKSKTIVLQIEVPVESGNMFDLEHGLQRALNEAGQLGTKELRELFESPNKNPSSSISRSGATKEKLLKAIKPCMMCPHGTHSVSGHQRRCYFFSA